MRLTLLTLLTVLLLSCDKQDNIRCECTIYYSHTPIEPVSYYIPSHECRDASYTEKDKTVECKVIIVDQ